MKLVEGKSSGIRTILLFSSCSLTLSPPSSSWSCASLTLWTVEIKTLRGVPNKRKCGSRHWTVGKVCAKKNTNRCCGATKAFLFLQVQTALRKGARASRGVERERRGYKTDHRVTSPATSLSTHQKKLWLDGHDPSSQSPGCQCLGKLAVVINE